MRYAGGSRLDRSFGESGVRLGPRKSYARPKAVLPTRHRLIVVANGCDAGFSVYGASGRPEGSALRGPGVPRDRFNDTAGVLPDGKLVLGWHGLCRHTLTLERFAARSAKRHRAR